MFSHVKIMDSVVPETPLPRHPLCFEGYGQVDQDVPRAGRHPSPYVKDLRFSIEIDDKFPEEFFEYNPWLTGVKRLAFRGIGVFRCRRYLSFGDFRSP